MGAVRKPIFTQQQRLNLIKAVKEGIEAPDTSWNKAEAVIDLLINEIEKFVSTVEEKIEKNNAEIEEHMRKQKLELDRMARLLYEKTGITTEHLALEQLELWGNEKVILLDDFRDD